MGLLKNEATIPAKDIAGGSTGGSGMSGGFNAILDRGSEFEGKLTFEGTVRIDGKFKGEIISKAKLVIGEAGIIDANVDVESLMVSGEVNGDITAKGKIHLHPSATVRGNLSTPSLIIEEGAIFEGSCNMNKAAKISESKSSSGNGIQAKPANA